MNNYLEKIVFGNNIVKINQDGWSQSRTFGITSEQVYNIKNGDKI